MLNLNISNNMTPPPEPKLLPKVYYSNEYMTRVIMDEDFEKWNTRPTPNAASCLECETIGQSACPEHGTAEEIMGNLNKKNSHRPECKCATCIAPNAASGEVDDVRIKEIADKYTTQLENAREFTPASHFFKQAILEATKDLLAQIAVKDEALKKYGRHVNGCPLRNDRFAHPLRCDCGYINALTNSPSSAGDSNPLCTWKYCSREESWDTACGEKYQFRNPDGPIANGHVFCHHCGLKLVIEDAKPEVPA